MRGPNRDSFRTNYIITAIWALAFAVMVAAEFALLYFPPKQLGIDVTVARDLRCNSVHDLVSRNFTGQGHPPSMKRPVPVTSCTECGNAGYIPTLINLRCGKTINGERCKSTNQAQSTILIGNNAHLATAVESNVTQLAFGVEEWNLFLSEGELTGSESRRCLCLV